MSKSILNEVAVWDWQRDPVPPDARVIVTGRGDADDEAFCRIPLDAQRRIQAIVTRDDRCIVSAHGSTALYPGRWPLKRVIPALYIERQTDLVGMADLLSVQAEHRALVLSPREALDLMAANPWDPSPPDIAHPMLEVIDLVVIIPPPESRTCGTCSGDPQRGRQRDGRGDLAVVGCIACQGTGRIEPWPMHPAWVRGIVEQCRAAGVPVVFLGWGRYLPAWNGTRLPDGLDIVGVTIARDGPHDWFDVGTARSGRLLDGAEVMEVPEWLT